MAQKDGIKIKTEVSDINLAPKLFDKNFIRKAVFIPYNDIIT